MLRIDLKQFGKSREAALEYLRSRLDEPLKVKGDQVTLANTKPGEAKTLLHKFLHHAQLDRYHVAVINSGLIEIRPVEVKKKQRTRGKGGATPAPWETVGDQWWLKPPGFARPGKRSKRQIHRQIRGLS